jgi:hypothetical protein
MKLERTEHNIIVELGLENTVYICTYIHSKFGVIVEASCYLNYKWDQDIGYQKKC